ncbi:MAG TPA: peptidylprolyl isomerase [Ktedonobacteraceae bacterium]|nr:peptidylprolyl isomerase [Ktedonobacteraceae bacterium]
MPKTSKREETRRAARVARLHTTQAPVIENKKEPVSRRDPGYIAPKRGLSRYPWGATILVILVIALAGYVLYYYHLGPFKQPVTPIKTVAKAHTTPTVTVLTPTPVASYASSPCLKLTKQLTDTAPAPTTAQFNAIKHTYSAAPAMSINTGRIYCAGINTDRGLIVVELDPKIAPITVNNFVFLAQHQFYNGDKFHRVVPSFIIQSGDPTGTGTGGPGYKFKDEKVQGNYTAGCLAMANSGANTNGSQFFICTANDTSKLAKSYNLFGHVVLGLNIAQAITGPGDTTASKSITPDVINHIVVVEAPAS